MRDSCGTGGQVRHLRVKRTNVAHRLPRGKRVPVTEINHFQEHRRFSNHTTISRVTLHLYVLCYNYYRNLR
ncbi:hypothetical protein QUF49_00135 [Fictibacillus sp. b24]|uniref:hypothetical protein n=1 Tax=Fictibacillus sp. b24 TaxID=3055863 RepID=UPI0025A028DF|nr:hypothetical protein [Fictibacillus sp. b24]MDM5314387.1 hypothetical protein [Fictibacillus sp. b24]